MEPSEHSTGRRYTWQDDAACASIGVDREYDPFFPEKSSGNADVMAAKKLCNTCCPVRDQCREFALNWPAGQYGHLYGVWGGLSETDRYAIQRKIKAAAALKQTQTHGDAA